MFLDNVVHKSIAFAVLFVLLKTKNYILILVNLLKISYNFCEK